MNLSLTWNTTSKLFFDFATRLRFLLPKQRCHAFGNVSPQGWKLIERVYVINLDRQPNRWKTMTRELKQILDNSGDGLDSITRRVAAIDGNQIAHEPSADSDVNPVYTLRDQLFVDPQPLIQPERFQLDAPIRMSRPEIAIARSHISVWRRIANGNHDFVLVLEDDGWFRPRFAERMNRIWDELKENEKTFQFDILYLSYQEVTNGAPKVFVSENLFCPERGLWQLSGYVVSRAGAQELLRRLPCRGPVDLWLNQQFADLKVRAARRAIIAQRRDGSSTNEYSILPTLTKVGAITSETASLFQSRPRRRPVFAFGPPNSGLSPLAMALSMLGYRCCSDLNSIPKSEHERLLAGNDDRVFNAYINIGVLEGEIQLLRLRFPHAKFIITTSMDENAKGRALEFQTELVGADVVELPLLDPNKWNIVCQHLESPPPNSSFPDLPELGQRTLTCESANLELASKIQPSRRDSSPWVIESRSWWKGLRLIAEDEEGNGATSVTVTDRLETLDARQWFVRDDTFAGNLALFRPSNITWHPDHGATLSVRPESLGVRDFSASSLSSCDRYVFGRFEAVIKASNVPGVVTGFFLHRDSPKQEIDIEIAGHRPDRLLANVFYNPGSEGTKYDFGYRGAATYIDLGFDASKDFHRYVIEWAPNAIRWFVDNRLVHERVEWDPTPIPRLPMALHLNIWPSCSKELAGRFARRRLPTTACIRSINIEAKLASSPRQQ